MYLSDSLGSSLWQSDQVRSGRASPNIKTRNYTVKEGECLPEIVRKLTGSDNWRPVYELNKEIIGSNPNYIEAGLVIIIPDAVAEERDDDD